MLVLDSEMHIVLENSNSNSNASTNASLKQSFSLFSFLCSRGVVLKLQQQLTTLFVSVGLESLGPATGGAGGTSFAHPSRRVQRSKEKRRERKSRWVMLDVHMS